MLIEQIIEFQLRDSGPPGRTCTSTTGQLHDKTKISVKQKSSSGLLFTAKILQEAMCLTTPTWTELLAIKILYHNARY